jgi:hypothetical protein
VSRPISLGYLRPTPARLWAGSWTVIGPTGAGLENPELLEDWDYSANLSIRRRVEVDLAGVRADCGLGEGARLSLVLLWRSSWTGLRGGSPPVSVRDGVNDLALDLRGELLGGALNLEARLILDEAPTRSSLSPGRPGSTLWTSAFRLALEGVGMRFPVVRTPFRESGIPGGDGGVWTLQLDTYDLDASASGNVRLLLNSDHPAVADLLDRPESPSGKMLQEFLHYDLARQLVVAALRHEDLDRAEYDEGSMGELLSSTVNRFFDRSLEQLRGDLRTDPGGLEAEVQARIGLLQG